MQKGFTLIELSIVLVVIGLLIGGLLAAKSMISTAKIASQVAQIQQFDAATMAYKSKFKYLPGDNPKMGGDGNGVITASSYSENFSYEIANYWYNLMPEKFIAPGSIYENSVNVPGQGMNAPLAKLGPKKSFVIATAMGDGVTQGAPADMANPRNYYLILDGHQTNHTTWHKYIIADYAAVKPIELRAMDEKMDDGKATSGGVISGGLSTRSGTPVGGLFPYPRSSCSNGDDYVVTNDSFECHAAFRIGALAGDPS